MNFFWLFDTQLLCSAFSKSSQCSIISYIMSMWLRSSIPALAIKCSTRMQVESTYYLRIIYTVRWKLEIGTYFPILGYPWTFAETVPFVLGFEFFDSLGNSVRANWSRGSPNRKREKYNKCSTENFIPVRSAYEKNSLHSYTVETSFLKKVESEKFPSLARQQTRFSSPWYRSRLNIALDWSREVNGTNFSLQSLPKVKDS